ncbi:unnamed protein product [Schistosoma mattheei]|uniref:Uncharacterized protein n=1 Tax=Schistosoma mattheei TaxID=31246 RepID=A0A3P8IXV2_9TREM|nr:unnamed protein product [Schistosoma mattheei]
MKSDCNPYGVTSDVICHHNGFIFSDIPSECDKYVPNVPNSSHISDVIVSDVGYSHNQCMTNRIPSQLSDESEGIKSFIEAVREPVYLDLKLAQAQKSNHVQDYPKESEADAYFPFDCFAGESSPDESRVIIAHIDCK